MNNLDQMYVDGRWVAPSGTAQRWIVEPASEERIGALTLGDEIDVDRAVSAARGAFASYSRTSVPERLELLDSIAQHYQARFDELVEAVTLEMGAPRTLSREDQVPAGLGQFRRAREALSAFEFGSRAGTTAILYEPVGVCALITPWNWPLLLIGSKVATVMCGGDVEGGSLVDEQWFLDLERKHFMELIATEKTQARIEHTLKTGKPLRN